MKKFTDSSNVTIAESEELIHLVQSNVTANGESSRIAVTKLEWHIILVIIYNSRISFECSFGAGRTT